MAQEILTVFSSMPGQASILMDDRVWRKDAGPGLILNSYVER